jgi:hypothetical protein
MKYVVQELTAHKWFAVRTFSKKEDAEAFAKWLGNKARVKEIKTEE